MTACGRQGLAKTAGIRPEARVLLAGAGPFLPPAARTLLDAGADVVAEATPWRRWLHSAARLRHTPGRLAQLARYEARLMRARVPRLFGHVIRHAERIGTAAAPTEAGAARGSPASSSALSGAAGSH